MGAQLSQMFPRTAPPLTETNIPPQKHRVFLVTGGYGGIGYHISRVLYHAGGTVYIAGRNDTKAHEAIKKIKASPKPDNPALQDIAPGKVVFLNLDLSDLSTVKPAADQFLSHETKLDVLFHNAGVSLPPKGSRSAQGHELTVATNCLGPWLLNHYLTPALAAAAKHNNSGSKGGTRVIWTSSQVVDLSAPKGVIEMSELDNPPKTQDRNYMNSKTGNYFLASEFHRRVGRENGILSITVNPGGLKTDILRHTSWLFRLCVSPLLHDSVMGAYAVLWASASGELNVEEDGGWGWVVPWGRKHAGLREDLLECVRAEGSDEEGGNGNGKARMFWEWCEGRCKEFM